MDRITIGELVFSPYIPHRPVSLRKEAVGIAAMFGKKEWRLLDALWQCEGTMVTRRYLFLCVYSNSRDRPADIRAIDVLAFRVRKKLALLLGGENCIHKIWQEGYMFRIPKCD
jgi:DNA-binding response OmpR family regulator